MMHLVEDILDLSKIQFDNFEKNLSWFRVSDIVKEVFEIV